MASLPAGTYTIALTLPNNFSFAENYGSGTLGDGFIGLQSDYYDFASGKVRTSAYAFDVTYAPTGTSLPAVPEPSSFVLLASGLAVSLHRSVHKVLSSHHC